MKIFKLAILFFIASIYTYAFSFTVYIVKSEENEMYDKMIYSFKERAEYDFVSFNLNNSGDNVKIVINKMKSDKPDAVLLVGSYAIKEVAPLVSSTPLILSMSTSISQSIKDKTNVCGVIFENDDSVIFEYIKTALPSFKNIGIIFSVDNTIDYAKSFKTKGEETGINVELGNIASLEDLLITCKMLKASGVTAVWLGKDKLIVSKSGFETLLKITKDENLPIIAPYTTFTQKGAACSISPDIANHGFLCGNLAIRIYNGENPKEIGFSKTQKASFAYNKNMLKLFGINIPSAIIENAKEY